MPPFWTRISYTVIACCAIFLLDHFVFAGRPQLIQTENTITVNDEFNAWIEVRTSNLAEVCMLYLIDKDTGSFTLEHPSRPLTVNTIDDRKCFQVESGTWEIKGTGMLSIRPTLNDQVEVVVYTDPFFRYVVLATCAFLFFICYLVLYEEIESYMEKLPSRTTA